MDQSNLIVPRHLRIPLARAVLISAYKYLVRYNGLGVPVLRSYIREFDDVTNLILVLGQQALIPEIPIDKCAFSIRERLLSARTILHGEPLLVSINLDFGDTE